MQALKISCLLFFVILFAGCAEKPTPDGLRKFAATETYPDDCFLDTVSNKRALVIVAHDDDDCAMAGTIAGLTADGWNIRQLSLTSHLIPGKDHNAAILICQGNDLILDDGNYRRGIDTVKFAYLPIPLEEIKRQYLYDRVATSLITMVNAFRPSVIFTLDNVKGGYGHPDHIFISQLVLDLFNDSTIHAERIYQSVYTDHMEKEIVDKWLSAKLEKWKFPNASKLANELYGIDGMPGPDVQVNIQKVAGLKMEYLRAYPEEVRKNLRKFIPYYEQFDAETYFSIFDREFFRVIRSPE